MNTTHGWLSEVIFKKFFNIFRLQRNLFLMQCRRRLVSVYTILHSQSKFENDLIKNLARTPTYRLDGRISRATISAYLHNRKNRAVIMQHKQAMCTIHQSFKS